MTFERIGLIILFIYSIFCFGSLISIIRGHIKPSHKILLIIFIIFNLICIFVLLNFIGGNIWIFSVYEEYDGHLCLRVVYNKKHKPYSKYPNNILAYDVYMKIDRKDINKGDILLVIPGPGVSLLESAPGKFSSNNIFIMKINIFK